jgi:hypothetical protein
MAQEAIRALLREKRDIQQQFIAQRRGALQHERHQGTLDGLGYIRANLTLLKIELELAETPAEQRAVLEKMLKEARTVEEVLLQMRAERAVVPEAAEIFQAQVERLNIQIQLEETKAKK